jgi:Flp pilus assembly protein TadG
VSVLRGLFKTLNSEAGTAIILVTIMATALIGIAALVVDVGRVYHTYSTMRNAADAAALAGAQRLPDQSTAYSTAVSYASANGLDLAELEINVPYNGDQRMIEVKCSRTVNYMLAPVLGFTDQLLTARAVAMYGNSRVFDYALFSGSRDATLKVAGANLNITGDVHTNSDAKFTGANVTIDGALEAMGRIEASTTNHHITEVIEGAPFVNTPVWDMDELRSIATRTLIGNQHFNGGIVELDGVLFVEGDVKLNGALIRGTGTIIATGDIQISGSGISYATSSDAVCLYAGDQMKISGANVSIDGILYAPNSQIQVSSANTTVRGAVIGDIVLMHGSTTTIIHDQQAVEAVPFKAARLVV